ncbi:MAG: tRNA (adenosine(37)-N6)-threonylcarbamoyltransferase complex transferase subunit TsaD [Thaumarchaeota archaeon]|nr:tRNA (adenosine(37)-N6)-threonylcarbamoyltransferase complex transferase subunit TsaD [Nitrososphaerota archaeon]
MKKPTNKNLTCLGIESTAHTFGSSIVTLTEGNLGTIISDARAVYQPPAGSGIHPREAYQHHSEVCSGVLVESLRKAKIDMGSVDVIAYAGGPGLGPCLRVGAVVARSLAAYYHKPIIAANHAIGHIELACMLTRATNPIVLLVSGGHTAILAFSSGRWRFFGETLDITIGQLLDQFGRAAGYASPSGSTIERYARHSKNYLPLPYTLKGNDPSFSGILTSSKRLLSEGKSMDAICFSIQETAFSNLCEVTERALAFTEIDEVLLTGGVAANNRLQEMLTEMCRSRGSSFKVIPKQFSGDCGAQIAWVGLLSYLHGMRLDIRESIIRQSWRLDQVDIPWRH